MNLAARFNSTSFTDTASSNYLTFTRNDYVATTVFSVAFTWVSGSGFAYRKKNGKWLPYTKDLVITLDRYKDYVQFRGIGFKSSATARAFKMTGRIYASGSVTSLTDGIGIDKNVKLLPNCYMNMFYNCSSLLTPPELPAVNLTDSCYDAMFSGCTKLTIAPALPATTLASYCYESMFNKCSSLPTTMTLPGSSLATCCYNRMFEYSSVVSVMLSNIDESSGIFQPSVHGPLARDHTVSVSYYEPYNYLTFTNTQPNNKTATLSFKWAEGTGVEYRMDRGTWMTYTAGTSITLSKNGNNVQFRGYNVKTDSSNHFTINGYVSGGGSVTSLLDGIGNDADLPLTEKCFAHMFHDCEYLEYAPELPSKNLAKQCYSFMFYNCGLRAVPELPAMTLAEECYGEMFAYNDYITSIPTLPATTLAKRCYLGMFEWCQYTESDVTIDAITFAEGCFYFTLYNTLVQKVKFSNITQESGAYIPSIHGDFDNNVEIDYKS